MDAVTAENADGGAGELLRGARRIAAFLSAEFDEPITEQQVFYWAGTKKIRVHKLGNAIVATKTSLREDAAGKLRA